MKDFDLHGQKSFNPGQMYVALTRITSIVRMYLVTNYSKKAIKENSSAKKEYQRLRRESKLVTLPFISVSEITFNITLLIVRSLRKRYKDIMKDTHLLGNDLLCLPETQLPIDEDTSYILNQVCRNILKLILILLKTSIETLHFVIQILFHF